MQMSVFLLIPKMLLFIRTISDTNMLLGKMHPNTHSMDLES